MTPWGAVLEHPIEQGPFKTDIAPDFFALNPFMAKNFIPLCQKLTVKR